jgi:hypothetical protein
VEGPLLAHRLLHVAVVQAATPDHEIQQHADQREDEDQQRPPGLGYPRQVGTPEDVAEHEEQATDPGKEEAERGHGHQHGHHGIAVHDDVGSLRSSSWSRPGTAACLIPAR